MFTLITAAQILFMSFFLTFFSIFSFTLITGLLNFFVYRFCMFFILFKCVVTLITGIQVSLLVFISSMFLVFVLHWSQDYELSLWTDFACFLTTIEMCVYIDPRNAVLLYKENIIYKDVYVYVLLLSFQFSLITWTTSYCGEMLHAFSLSFKCVFTLITQIQISIFIFYFIFF